MSEAQGFEFEPSELMAFAESTSRLAGMATEAGDGLSSAGQLPGDIFGEVGGSSGFMAAYGERSTSLLRGLESVRAGVDGLAAAVRDYCTTKLSQDDDRAADIRQAENV